MTAVPPAAPPAALPAASPAAPPTAPPGRLPAASPGGPPDGLPVPRRYWSMLAIALALTLAVLDGAIANVALPTIAADLGADPAAAIWIVNGYQLAVTVSLLPMAALGERVGYRRVYVVGLAVFTAASLGCALAGSLGTLVAARVLQGLGAAGIMSVNGALVRFTYPRALLGRAVGLNAFTVAFASALGPTVASAVLAGASWPWLFGINVPLGIVTVLVAARALPASERTSRRVDATAALLNALGFGLVITGVESLAQGPDAASALQIAAGLAALALLVRREFSVAAPLVPLDLLRIPVFGLSIATSVCAFAAQMLSFVALPFHLQHVLGRDAVATGLMMTPWPLAVAVAAPLAGRLSDRIAPGALGGAGLAAMAAGLALLALLPADASTAAIAWRMALCGAGFGLFQAPNNRAMLSSAPRERSGAAGGMLATARLIGQTAGTTAVALLFHWQPRRATTAALGAAAIVSAVAAGVSLLRLRPAVRRAERRATLPPARSGGSDLE